MSAVLAPAAIAPFLTAGHATVTVENPGTGGRFTYRVDAPGERTAAGGFKRRVEERVRFVKVLTGPDNTSDYEFLGTLFLEAGRATGAFRLSPKSRIHGDAASARAFAWLWERVVLGRDLGPVVVRHDGCCGRCGRKLTVPESVDAGIGPECAGKGL